MRAKGYKILGIDNEMYEKWKDNLREDLIVYERNGKVQIRIVLTGIEAFCMRIRMVMYNLKNPCVLRLQRDI